jgi:predicted nucleic acid-binding Zn ribbon protein
LRTLPDPIGKQVRRELDRFGPEGRMGEIVAAWPAAVGPGIAANAWPARVGRDGTLHVNTASSTWAFELTQLSSSVLERVREQLGGDYPSALRFVAGPLPEAAEDVKKLRDRTAPRPTPEQIERGGQIAASIDDTELREAVAKAVAASFALGSSPPDDRSV